MNTENPRPQNSKPQNPRHDQLFRKSLENPVVAYELLQAHLPREVLTIIDTTTIKLEKESFVEADLSASIADVLFSVKFNDTEGYIYLLLEHVRHEVAHLKSAVNAAGLHLYP
ncbi:MAG: hypothetical protein EB127_11675 [Alphaproteobacteria bacterium]|nr:hypothetical protein [Alphaproteobacteria bacterium]